MNARSLVGDDHINEYLTLAMNATLDSLVRRGLLERKVADDFAADSVCMMVVQDGPFTRWFKRVIGDDSAGSVAITIARLDA